MAPADRLAEALRLSVKEGERLRSLNRRLAEASKEPIAIVGMSCRLPGGVRSPAQLWQLLAEGRDGIGRFPSDRGWDAARIYHSDPDGPPADYTHEGGFVDAATEFDAGFFGISPREALITDPQQRTMLEACWEALEDVGIVPASVRGSHTGVFAGVMYQDYAAAAGMTSSIVSGRVAYALGLEGPAMSVDTACSSSLVAMHLAAQALRGEECSLALAGGVTVLSTPAVFTEFSRQRGLAPDGRSKSFAEAADGAGFAEGVGVLVLERLSDARRHGHPILATIRGSAVNQDGASNGLTAPNGPAQERVIRQALANAGLQPADVDAVEAHGTGTTLGDPIEAGALLATYGQDRERPLYLGSIKSNIGHAQAAAGVAGVIKMVEAMRRGALPGTLHVDAPSSKVDWEAGQIELLSEAREWEADGRPRRAGVSSFGISGTNAHLILEEAPRSGRPERGDERRGEAGQGPVPLPLSARSDAALADAAGRLADHLREEPELDLRDVGYSIAVTRTAFQRRAAVVAEHREELLAKLDRLAQRASLDGTTVFAAREGHLAYLLAGQGSQRLGMGCELRAAYPVYAQAFDETCGELDRELPHPLAEIVAGTNPGAEELLAHTTYAQPALFAVEVALFRLLESLGLVPGLLAGHSVGEIAAAHLAGVLSLPDAARLVAARGRLMGELPSGGAMVAIEATEEEARDFLDGGREELAIGAINGPRAIVLSGRAEAIEQARAHWKGRGRRAKRLAVSHAFHSPLIEPMLDRFAAVAEELDYAEPAIPIVSNRSGALLAPAEAADPAYWVAHAREAVRFGDAVRTLDAEGASAFVELGPGAVLAAMAEACLASRDGESPPAIPTLREGRSEPSSLVLALAQAHAAGAAVDWEAFFAGVRPERVPLPTYPFQRRRYWLAAPPAGGGAGTSGLVDAAHPLLGAVIEDPGGEAVALSGRLSVAAQSWLADCTVGGCALVPAGAFLEMALRAGREVDCGLLEELEIVSDLVLDENEAALVKVSVAEPDEDGRRQVSIHARPDADGAESPAWRCHASGVLSSSGDSAQLGAALGGWPPEEAEALDVEAARDRFADAGIEYGPAMLGLRAAWRRGEDVFAEISAPEQVAAEAGLCQLHPALLEAALLAAAAGADQAATWSGAAVELPRRWEGVQLGAAGAEELRARLGRDADGTLSLALHDTTGAAVAAIAAIETRPPDLSRLRRDPCRRSLHRLEWTALSATPADSHPPLACLGERPGLPEAERYADLGTLRDAIEAGAAPPRIVLADRRAGGGGQSVDAVHAAGREALELLTGWLAAEPLAESRLVLLTEGALAASDSEDPDLRAATVAGLLRSACSEHPDRFALLDVDGSAASAEALAGALSATDSEPQIALRGGALLAPRLARVEGGEDGVTAALDAERTILVTGGTSGIGARVARHLVAAHGAERLLLVSRSGMEAPGAPELRSELEGLGAAVTIAACDVADREALATLLESIPARHPLGAVFHSAAVLDDGVLESLDGERLRRVMRPKVDAAWHLHELTDGMQLSHFVLFSSAAGILGGAAQGSYAAANAFLDALAQHRRAAGLPGTSLAWGLWNQSDAIAGRIDEEEMARLAQRIRARLGFAPMRPEHGLALLDAACSSGEALLAPVMFDSAALRAQAQRGILPPVLHGLVRAPARAAGPAGALAERLAAVPVAEREPLVLDLVRAEVANVLGHASADEVDVEGSFQDQGFDSLAAVELRNRLGAATGVRLPATVVFDRPSPAELAEFLCAEAQGVGEAAAVAPAARASDEPVVIVGIGCRYPGGAGSPERLWELLEAGTDAIAPFPGDRGWDLEEIYDPDPDHPGTSYVREGGFVDGAAAFDAAFFGISPREAVAMDPQQRLLLEVSWEALERAGLDPQSMRGSETGVFVGVGGTDYGFAMQGHRELEAYMGIGLPASVASGRIAYALGLVGPALSVDTACSSSLVALHLGARALQGGECSLALAGGATVLATPNVFVFSSRQRGVAPDGRSKSFAESADGAGFSEGAGMVVLERLSDAERNGHPVLAVVRGSALNQDGASNGLAAPNGPAQERVIRQALANAGLKPGEVDAVEAHGTGTVLGDPIEAGALLAVYGGDREQPLRLGSIKSNIGHTQSAAGIAGVIKMTMAMRAGLLPKSLHVDAPSSKVDWGDGRVELLADALPWTANGRPRRAGVSSFGVSGTNAHLILEEAPDGSAAQGGAGDSSRAGDAADPPLSGLTPLVLSAKSRPALTEAATRLRGCLEGDPGLEPVDVSHSLLAGRATPFNHRAVALGGNRRELVDALAALAEERDDPAACIGFAASPRRAAFLFPGQGSQWVGMATDLLETSVPFARKLGECREALEPHLAWSFERVLHGRDPMPDERTDITQPMLFAVMVSLADLWRLAGVEPSVVAGQSQGEIAAAHVAGGLTLEDAARVVALRSRLIQGLAGSGRMISVGLAAAEVKPRFGECGDRVEVAALTGPSSVVLSGAEDALDLVMRECAELGVRAKDIPGAIAPSHSFQVETVREEMLEALGPIAPRSSEVPFHSTVTGELLDTAELDAEYWYRNARRTVRLDPTVRALLGNGCRALLEVSPHPVLAGGLREIVEDAGELESVSILSTLRRGEGGAQRFASALGEAYSAGVGVEWSALLAGGKPKRVPLPSYPFQRTRYWLESASTNGQVAAAGLADPRHPLLGAAVDSPRDGRVQLTGRIGPATHGWLADQAIGGAAVVPGAALAELALAAGRRTGAEAIEALELREPLLLPERGSLQVSVMVGEADEDGRRSVDIHSRLDRGDEPHADGWTEHADGMLAPAADQVAPPPQDLVSDWPPSGVEPLDRESVYDELADRGLELGPSLECLRRAWRRDDGATFAEIVLREEDAEAQGFGLHPALLEAATHAALVSRNGIARPTAWRGLRLLHGGDVKALRVLVEEGDDRLSLFAADDRGEPVLSVESFVARPLDLERIGLSAPREPLYRVHWKPRSPEGNGSPPDATVAEYPALAEVEEWIAAEPRRSRLIVLTSGAVAASEGDSVEAGATAIWGRVRSALCEQPERFALIDSDRSAASKAALPAAVALAAAEPQLALREGQLLVPRLARASAREQAEPPAHPQLLAPASPAGLLGDPGGEGELAKAPPGLSRSELRAAAAEGRLPAALSALVPEEAHRREVGRGSLRSRLASAPADAREALVLEHLRGQLAALLGHGSPEEVEVELTLQEMGLDSLGAVELCKRLEAATGVPIQVLALARHPTPRALAGDLAERIAAADQGSARPAAADTLLPLLGRAREQEALGEFVELLTAVARFRPSFDAAADAAAAVGVVRLAAGDAAPPVLMTPSAGAASGPHEYVRFAKAFQGERTVLSLPLPGFLPGEALPSSVGALAELLADAVLELDPGPGLVLAGHSSGGWVAHALAGRLESAGLTPAAVVLLDSYWPLDGQLHRIAPLALEAVHEAAEANAGIDDARLTAMGGYRGVFAGWRPDDLAAPTLLVRAGDPAARLSGAGDWQASWELPHTVVDVAGDHMSMMREHAGTTADAVRGALAGIESAPRPQEVGR